MASRALLLTISVLVLAGTTVSGLPDDAYVAYLSGADVAALEITTLDGVAVKGSSTATAFFTLTDFGKNLTSWTLDPVDKLPKAAALKLFYYTPAKASNPPKLFDLTVDFSDPTPFGEFNVTKLNAALTAIGEPTVGGDTAIGPLAAGRFLLAAWISSDGFAIVGRVSDDPDVGPEVPVYTETAYLTSIIPKEKVFNRTGLVGAGGTLDIEEKANGDYNYQFYTDLALGASNETVFWPYELWLVAATYPKVVLKKKVYRATKVYKFDLPGRKWLRAASDTGTSGVIKRADILKGLKGIRGVAGPKATLLAALYVSDINRDFANYGQFDPYFKIVVPKALG